MQRSAVILVIIFLVFFLKTRLGLAIRATGNNSDMVKSSSINPVFTTVIGLCVANAFTALSGCLLSQSQKSVDINIGQGMVTIALASLLIGGTILGRGGIFVRAVGMVLGSFYFPPGLYNCSSFQYAGIYAETGVFCHRCSCNLRSLPQETVAADSKKNDTYKRRQMIHVKNQPYFQDI